MAIQPDEAVSPRAYAELLRERDELVKKVRELERESVRYRELAFKADARRAELERENYRLRKPSRP